MVELILLLKDLQEQAISGNHMTCVKPGNNVTTTKLYVHFIVS